VQRALLVLEQQGGDGFFGEKALAITDLMQLAPDGRGYVSVLAADKLMQSPQLYATFLLWLMSELFEALPEVGDPEKPKLVFFFDEAHLLFDGAPKVLVDKVEQVVKLIRSKGVGVYFVTQNPVDIPESVLAQLGNRVQHALRAYTPREQQAVKVAADTFRPNPAFSTAEVISQLGIGEALVSVLEDKGIPSVVGRTMIRPPSSRLGPITPGERIDVMARSPLTGLYDTPVDRESAYEVLTRKAAAAAPSPQPEAPASPAARGRAPAAPRPSNRESFQEAAIKSFTRAMASSAGRQVMNAVGRELVRGILGGLMRR
jgi:DNA helicase HerA-like ATPase